MSVKYCERCKNVHEKEELCSDLKNQLQNDPNLISEAMNFTNLAAQHQLISTQALDGVAMSINKIANTGLTFEGSKQCARDIQVFQQLNVDAFKNSGVFNDPKLAQRYVQSGGTSIENNLKRKLTGTAQEVDWLRNRKGSLTRIFEKAKLVGEETANAPGIDGMVKNRITGTERGVSVKNSISNKGLGTNVRDVLKAIDKGTINPDDRIVGTDGIKNSVEKMLNKNIDKAVKEGNQELLEKLKIAKDKMKVQEIGNFEEAKNSTERLTNKVKSGEAYSRINSKMVAKQMKQGGIIGAAVSFSTSSLFNYLKYKNGEITREKAFAEIGQETCSGAIIGSAMGGLSLFFPPGAVGFATGIAVGMYISKTTQNVMNEIFGKGAFEQILHSSGYIYGTTMNLKTLLNEIEINEIKISENHTNMRNSEKNINKMSENISNILEDL
ncbi:hypothetical protein QI204_09860 [Staphylococcus saprophyticus]|uniref:hypothetical protein n=1 Tax=Staphylococcus saprophyticus TaxID=29385 RepID=UPI000852F56C|nr:hypothetical protein [Staphylococcus saprophyticus]MDW4233840.1 hypothetical protein [Staphylococcus saprophyticus]MDW4342256.1 hypothetical protein [Staphylococcus saprophyticus]MDW4387054.1 hypothetical protein [Staphylococcus saprophyticus]MDW4440632.1 hypothetical protein [Staphylococcus saprophyticus]MDW4473323.1 hypothetical protein [Staphylococcus saprophyticus]